MNINPPPLLHYQTPPNVNTSGATSIPPPPLKGVATTRPTIYSSGYDTNTTATTTTAGATSVVLPPANGTATTCTVIGDSGSDNNTNTTATDTGSW